MAGTLQCPRTSLYTQRNFLPSAPTWLSFFHICPLTEAQCFGLLQESSNTTHPHPHPTPEYKDLDFRTPKLVRAFSRHRHCCKPGISAFPFERNQTASPATDVFVLGPRTVLCFRGQHSLNTVGNRYTKNRVVTNTLRPSNEIPETLSVIYHLAKAKTTRVFFHTVLLP